MSQRSNDTSCSSRRSNARLSDRSLTVGHTSRAALAFRALNAFLYRASVFWIPVWLFSTTAEAAGALSATGAGASAGNGADRAGAAAGVGVASPAIDGAEAPGDDGADETGGDEMGGVGLRGTDAVAGGDVATVGGAAGGGGLTTGRVGAGLADGEGLRASAGAVAAATGGAGSAAGGATLSAASDRGGPSKPCSGIDGPGPRVNPNGSSTDGRGLTLVGGGITASLTTGGSRDAS